MKAPLKYKGGYSPEGEVFGELEENSANDSFVLIYDAETSKAFFCCYSISSSLSAVKQKGITAKIKIYKMKNINKIAVFVLATSLTMIGCEKDENMTPNNTNNAEMNTKTNSFNTKSASFGVVKFEDFLESIIDPGVSVDDESSELALYLTETILDFRLRNSEKIPYETESFDTTFYVTVTNDGGSLVILGSDILTMNEDLFDGIANHADVIEFDDTGLDKIVSSIDLEWETLVVGENEITALYSISNFQPNVGSCTENDSWYPLFDDGGCNGNTASTGDAAKQINKIVNYVNCNSNIINCSSVHHFVRNIVTINNVTSMSGIYSYTTNSVWNNSTLLDCLSPTKINELADSCIWISQDIKPSGFTLYSTQVSGNVLLASPPNPPHYLHSYNYTYAEACEGSVTHKPEPLF